jgi:hypothetical protein
MNQKLSDWASAAEIVSGIAVVVTLVFLILGIRENTNITRASMYQDIVEETNDFQEMVTVNPEMLRVWTAYIQGDATEFDELDNQRLNSIVLTQFRTFESAYYSRNYAVIGEREWGRIDRTICDWVRRANSVGKDRLLTRLTTPEFTSYLAERCST